MKIVLVCSSGGHLQELVRLRSAWEEYDHVWVTFPGLDTDELLAGERVCHASHPTNRNPWNLLRNTWMAWRDPVCYSLAAWFNMGTLRSTRYMCAPCRFFH